MHDYFYLFQSDHQSPKTKLHRIIQIYLNPYHLETMKYKFGKMNITLDSNYDFLFNKNGGSKYIAKMKNFVGDKIEYSNTYKN